MALDDPKLRRIVNVIENVVKQWRFPNAVLFQLGTWAIELFDPLFKTAVSLGKALEDLIVPYIRAHKDTQSFEEHKDYLDSYLGEIKKCKDPKSSFFKTRGEESLLASLMDLFLGGVETTAATLTSYFR